MQQVASEKARTDTAVSVAGQQHERELEERFAEDVRLKKRLSQFARVNELDKALVALWKEINCYPAWSNRDEYSTSYSCFDVSAFKKRGNWAKVLLQYHGQIQIAQNKSSAELKYFRADEIKSRFKE